MSTTKPLKPRILYHVAKAAWDGTLFEQREKICQLVYDEFKDTTTRRHIANQIRIAMGLHPHDSDTIITEHDEEALMGINNTQVIVANPDACQKCSEENRSCVQACSFNAITHDEYGTVTINHEKCLGGGHCVSACSFGALAEKSQFVPLIKLLKDKNTPIYASLAPAFAGQFGPEVTPGKLRSALLTLGFTDVIETALYADLVTMKEAFEFAEHVKSDTDFLLTSCCCPVWIKLIENKFPELIEHISPSVSPMVASARIIKHFEPNAKVVFIGPCIAKKTEAKLPDLAGAVDYVLTFQELKAIFAATQINPEEQIDAENATASYGGRVYAHTGGVSTAVAITLEKLLPEKAKKFTALQVDGIANCQKILSEMKHNNFTANFIEGMACKGGCIGGPGVLVPPEHSKSHVDSYAASSPAASPVENPHVYALLTRLGHEHDVSALTKKTPIAKILARNLQMDNS